MVRLTKGFFLWELKMTGILMLSEQMLLKENCFLFSNETVIVGKNCHPLWSARGWD